MAYIKRPGFPRTFSALDYPQNVIYVTDSSQLAGTLDSSKLYIIDGEVDMGSTSIVVPSTGLNIGGLGFGISKLFSVSSNYTLFVTDGVTYSGDLFLTDLDLEVSGGSSKVFELDNNENSNAVEWNTVNFINCTSLGSLTDYRQGLSRNVAFISILDGLTMSGTWSGGWAALDSILIGAPMTTGVLFRAGAGLVIGGSFRSDMNLLSLGTAGGIFCDFAPGNITLDAGFSLANVRANPLANNLPNLLSSSTKALITNSPGIGNTYPGGVVGPTTDSEVVIGSSDTLYQLTGAMSLSEAYWFSVANNNGLKSDSINDVEVVTLGTMSFSGSNNNEMVVQLRKYDVSASAYVNIGPEYRTTLNGGPSGGRAENISFHTITSMSQDDRIEVWIKNITGTGNITLVAGGQLQVLSR
tara:strand:+ start:46 stop:1281 length:1236 start_codon:yes stop_codon:yes gene_type:complete